MDNLSPQTKQILLLTALGLLTLAVLTPPLRQTQTRKRAEKMANQFSQTVYFPLRQDGSDGAKKIVPFLGNWKLGTYRRGYGWHTGVDWIMNRPDRGLAEPVFAMADGVVIDSSPTLSAIGYGNLVYIQHPQLGVFSRYAHLQSRSVNTGQVVKAGQVIGHLGKSGTDNTHLHFDIPTKPLPWSRYWPGISDNVATRQNIQAAFADPIWWLAGQQAKNPTGLVMT